MSIFDSVAGPHHFRISGTKQFDNQKRLRLQVEIKTLLTTLTTPPSDTHSITIMWAALGAIRACRSQASRTCYPRKLPASIRLLSSAATIPSSPHLLPPTSLPDLALPTLADLCLNEGDNVVVAASGGVDSSVTLRLLAELVSLWMTC